VGKFDGEAVGFAGVHPKIGAELAKLTCRFIQAAGGKAWGKLVMGGCWKG